MLTIVTSRTTISWAIPITTRISQRWSWCRAAVGVGWVTSVSFCHTEGVSLVNAQDGPRREDVTDGRARLAGGPVRGEPDPPAGGGLPDARLGERGRRRRPGGLAAAEPLGSGRHQGPAGVADHGRGARV